MWIKAFGPGGFLWPIDERVFMDANSRGRLLPCAPCAASQLAGNILRLMGIGLKDKGTVGHKNIQHTVRYTELSPDRFKDFWR